MSVPPHHTNVRSVDRLAAALLAVPALLSFVLILHHPALHGRHGVADVAAGIQAVARMDRIVHGGLIAMFALQTVGFFLFCGKLGWGRPAVAVGFLAYTAGVLLMVIPTTLDGFVTPDLAAACLSAPQGCGGTGGGVFRLVAAMIQEFTKAALIVMSAGTCAWAAVLLFGTGVVSRVAGAIGLLCAVAPVAVLLLSDIYLRPGNLAGMIAAQVVWSFVAAGVMGSGAHAPSPRNLPPARLG